MEIPTVSMSFSLLIFYISPLCKEVWSTCQLWSDAATLRLSPREEANHDPNPTTNSGFASQNHPPTEDPEAPRILHRVRTGRQKCSFSLLATHFCSACLPPRGRAPPADGLPMAGGVEQPGLLTARIGHSVVESRRSVT
jgi:hypothetical protein